jgi:hypothetical protein
MNAAGAHLLNVARIGAMPGPTVRPALPDENTEGGPVMGPSPSGQSQSHDPERVMHEAYVASRQPLAQSNWIRNGRSRNWFDRG